MTRNEDVGHMHNAADGLNIEYWILATMISVMTMNKDSGHMDNAADGLKRRQAALLRQLDKPASQNLKLQIVLPTYC